MTVLTKKEEERAKEAIIDQLEKLGGHSVVRENDVVFEGNVLKIPEKWTWKKVRDLADRKIAELAETDTWVKDFPYRPWDGAWCMMNALQRVFGTPRVRGHMGWFGPEPPQMLQIPSGVGTTVQVPWGVFSLPEHIPGVSFNLGSTNHPEKGPLFRINASGPKRMEGRVHGIFTLVEKELKTNSLYRGKAFDGQEMPEFIDVYSINRADVVYSEHVHAQMSASVWAHLQYTGVVASAGLHLKRSALLYGPFGTGKTLGALVTAQIAIENGWTFIKGRPGRDDIGMLLQTGLLYQPCVVFCEDVDAEMESADRSSINRMLDLFDGIQTKGTQMLCVMTTNYPERIQGGMIRPGRIDATIFIDDLDVAGVRKLVENRLGDRLADDVDWDLVFEHAQGYKPAYISEMADRTTLYLIAAHGDEYDRHPVTTEMLVYSADGLRDQFQLQEGAKGPELPESLEVAQRKIITEAVIANTDPDYHGWNGS